MANTPASTKPRRKRSTKKAVQPEPFISPDPHCGPPDKQLIVHEFLMGLNDDGLVLVQGLLKAMQPGGYKNGCHYLKAYFNQRPLPVILT